MFICTLRASTLKFVCVVGAAVLSLAILILLIPGYEPVTTAAIASANATYRFDKVKTTEDVKTFLCQFGWEVEASPCDEIEIRIPQEFDKVMNAYNELQKSHGLDLSKYRNKDVRRYTFRVTNYPDYNGTVFANVILYKNKVIGGDICSSDVTGFIHGFASPQKK